MGMIYLFFAIVFEVCGTTSMKLAEGFTRIGPSVAIGVFYTLSLGLLTMSLKSVDLGFAYAVWSGIGTAMIATIGVIWFREPATALKVFCLLLIIGGVVGLHVDQGRQAAGEPGVEADAATP